MALIQEYDSAVQASEAQSDEFTDEELALLKQRRRIDERLHDITLSRQQSKPSARSWFEASEEGQWGGERRRTDDYYGSLVAKSSEEGRFPGERSRRTDSFGSFVAKEAVWKGRNEKMHHSHHHQDFALVKLSSQTDGRDLLWDMVDKIHNVMYFQSDQVQGTLGQSMYSNWHGFKEMPQLEYKETRLISSAHGDDETWDGETTVKTWDGEMSNTGTMSFDGNQKRARLHVQARECYFDMLQPFYKDGGKMLIFQENDKIKGDSDQKNKAISTNEQIQAFLRGDSTFVFELRWGCRATWYGKIAQEPRYLEKAFETACPYFAKKSPSDKEKESIMKIAVPLEYDEDLAKKKVGKDNNKAIEKGRLQPYSKGLLYMKIKCKWTRFESQDRIEVQKFALYLKHNGRMHPKLRDLCKKNDWKFTPPAEYDGDYAGALMA